MSAIQWPFKRKQYAGMNNPRFVTDIVAANEATLDALIAVCGLAPVDFAIIAGLDYVLGIPNTYTPGIYYLNGSFYYQAAAFSEGLYLAPNVQDIKPTAFEDAVSRNIYTTMRSLTTVVSAGSSPVFSGDMKARRISNKVLKNAVTALQAITNALGSAAFENIGQAAGQVMAADDSRFLEIYHNVLTLNNVGPYTPSADYHPSTKLYADTAAGIKLQWLGNISSDGATVTKLAPTGGGGVTVTVAHTGGGLYTVTHNLGFTEYVVYGFGINGGSGGTASPRSFYNMLANSFQMVVSDDASANDTNTQLSIFKYF